MKYAFIRDHRDSFDIEVMCEVLGPSKSAYYDWVSRDHSLKQQRREELRIPIRKAFDESRGTYGSPRIYQVLKSHGYGLVAM